MHTLSITCCSRCTLEEGEIAQHANSDCESFQIGSWKLSCRITQKVLHLVGNVLNEKEKKNTIRLTSPMLGKHLGVWVGVLWLDFHPVASYFSSLLPTPARTQDKNSCSAWTLLYRSLNKHSKRGSEVGATADRGLICLIPHCCSLYCTL